MFDRQLRPYIDPPLNILGGHLAVSGVSANAVTLTGLALGLLAAAAIYVGVFWLALGLILASRLADGLDGAVARFHGTTDFGGYLDIASDYLFYGAVPLAFVMHDPATNGVAGAVLLTSFYVNGATFLGYSVLAERRSMRTASHGVKSIYFTAGLLEGTETIALFIAFCLWPGWVAELSWAFAGLCFYTAISRVVLAYKVFSN
ncbi:CDP-alcohol phosphatidyltransferase family protein [Roseicitreum antarcticum]|uniref:Phosphatidylglycerophosphate synthase n=1 Tax=Roseicitreum antarcticum TaxID=564137 RepID=A0A1H2QZJ5_9RHOB|nr:CDP-alcohol phosphatidyltransferase family protein [Roseicitreum antarcticum]SDW12054.1 Phosphatidylglycerophosphate synthase [Roseicitreum antarcticum]